MSLYSDVIKQKWELEKQVLKNALALATLRPDEFGYTIMSRVYGCSENRNYQGMQRVTSTDVLFGGQ